MNRILILVFAVFVLSSCMPDKRTQVPPPSKLPAVKVLFIGNGYTQYNQMPKMLEYISRTNLQSGFQIQTDIISKEGANLDDIWNDEALREKLYTQKWDFVVLQPHGTWAVNNRIQKNTYEAVRVWSLAIQTTKAKPVWFMTWIMQPGSAWYQKGQAAITRSPDFMFQHTYQQSLKLINGYKMLNVPIGSYWMFSHERHQDIGLYAENGAHPSLFGSYLNAVLFYRYLTGKDIIEDTFRPESISQEQFKKIKSIAYTELP